MLVSAFTPRGANPNPPVAQVNVGVTAAVQQINLQNAPYANETVARFVVNGTVAIAWCYGAQAGLTTSNGVLMLGNTVEVFSIPKDVTQISCIAGGVGSTLSIIVGDGF